MGVPIPLVIALNAIAAAVLWNRYSGTDAGLAIKNQIQSLVESFILKGAGGGDAGVSKQADVGSSCGLVPWASYVIVSDSVVLPGGVRPAAGA